MSDKEFTKDPRAVALANCVLFALGAYRNKPLYDPNRHGMTTTREWFKEALRKAGYGDLAQVKGE